MQNESLELMIYGDQIAKYKVSLEDTEKIKLNYLIKSSNPNYLFLNLSISIGAPSQVFKIHFSSKTDSFLVDYELKQKNTLPKQGLNGSDVMYLIMPDRFANGNTATDSVSEMKEQWNRSDVHGKHGGDLEGIINHLDYIVDLGVTAVWLNPVYENNMARTSYHGYSITDYYSIDPRLGTMDLYKTFVSKCHQKGLKVIKDMVFNHIGASHWWMDDLPAEDWLNNWTEFTRSNYSAPSVSDPHVSNKDRALISKGWFDSSMPDLNQKNKQVLNYLVQHAIWWIETTGIDGIRMDTYPYPDKAAMATWCKRIYSEYPGFYLVGETWLHTPAQIAYWTENNLRTEYNSPLKSASDFPVCFALERCFRDKKGIWEIYSVLTNDFVYQDPNNHKIFADNHDMDRLMHRVGARVDNFKLAMAFILTTRGIPQVFYGTEIGMNGSGPHGIIREDMPGGWTGDIINIFNGKNVPSEMLELHHFVKKILNWRKSSTVFAEDNLIHFVPTDEIYIYGRRNDREAIVVLLNNNEKDLLNFDLSNYQELFEGYEQATDIISGMHVRQVGNITLPAKTALILDLKQ